MITYLCFKVFQTRSRIRISGYFLGLCAAMSFITVSHFSNENSLNYKLFDRECDQALTI